MLRFIKLIFVISLMPLLQNNAYAQVVNCNGEWTNKPCDTAVTKAFSEVVKPEPTVEEQVLRRKNVRLQDLSLRNSKALRQYGVEVDVQLIRERCSKPTVPYEECAQWIGDTENNLVELVQKEKIVRAEQEKAAKLGDQTSTPPVIVVNPSNSGSYESLYDYCQRAPAAYRCRNFVQPGKSKSDDDEKISVNIDASNTKGDANINVNIQDGKVVKKPVRERDHSFNRPGVGKKSRGIPEAGRPMLNRPKTPKR